MVMSPAGVVETTMVEVGGMVSVKEGAIVFEIDPVAIVTTPGRIIIVGISGEFCLTHRRGGIVTPGIRRSGCIDNGCGSRVGRTYIDVRNGYAYSDVCTDENL
jgi:hypothetical protein